MGRGWRRKERERGWEEDGRYKDGRIKKGIREREREKEEEMQECQVKIGITWR